MNTEKMTDAYLQAVAFTETETGCETLEITPKARRQALRACNLFAVMCGLIPGGEDALSEMGESQAGHDLWLTRNGHGAGFWARGLGSMGESLTQAAHILGETHAETDETGLTLLGFMDEIGFVDADYA